MTHILNLETSALTCSVSIGRNESLLSSKISNGEWKHSREITILIQECLKDCNLAIDDIDAVAISGGPGSYTGLRVGASAAKGICYAKNIPLLSIDTLKIIAFPHLKSLSQGGFVIPMIDARRDEVYYNVYDEKLNAQIETTNLILNNDCLSQYKSKSILICGDASEKAEKLLETPSFEYITSKALAENMVQLSYERYKMQKFEDLAYYSPFYLKPPNITKSKKQLF